ncbi:2-dehydro-3-deoxy-phosphogluconate aldolase [Chelativorans composti]|jgi:Entner-Doudoroff aldolase|uniref:2-dehydro-3-deoxy-phosphogluconate aldolase n=1 Tax=Chelativorans composti TaxID=768533 RepID=A0ABW5DD95_9HYPH
MKKKTETLLALLNGQPVIPVLKIDDLAQAVPLARALVNGGLPAIEITLRTPVALEALRAVSREVPEAIVGAGTILSGEDFNNAVAAGAKFIVSPGSTAELLDTADRSDVPFLPGAATPSEIMALKARGYEILKFFPAEQSGGAPFLKALASPLAGVRFCPTGGISLKNAGDYLTLPNVICVGGSWVAPDADLKNGNWTRIEELAREAAGLRKG